MECHCSEHFERQDVVPTVCGQQLANGSGGPQDPRDDFPSGCVSLLLSLFPGRLAVGWILP